MARPEGWISWKEARVEHGLTYKVKFRSLKDNRHGANGVLLGLEGDQGHGTQCSDSWTRGCLFSQRRHKVHARLSQCNKIYLLL